MLSGPIMSCTSCADVNIALERISQENACLRTGLTDVQAKLAGVEAKLDLLVNGLLAQKQGPSASRPSKLRCEVAEVCTEAAGQADVRPPKVGVTLQTSGSEPVECIFSSDDTVQVVKFHVARIRSVHPERQDILHGAKILTDNDVLGDIFSSTTPPYRLIVVVATRAPCVQLAGSMQAVRGRAMWDAVHFDDVVGAFKICLSRDRARIKFDQSGTYFVTVSYRPGWSSEGWTAARLAMVNSSEACGTSAAYGTVAYDPHLTSVMFLAEVADIDALYELQLGRDQRSAIQISVDCAPLSNYGPIGGADALPAIVSSLSKTSGPCTQLEGPPQKLHGRATWVPLRFEVSSAGNGITLSANGRSIEFSTAGIYYITMTYRAGWTDDAWTAARLAIPGKACGTSVAYANMHGHDPHLTSVAFLADVLDIDAAYELQLGRDRRGTIHIDTDDSPLSHGPIGAVRVLPAVVATLLKAPGPCAQLEGRAQELHGCAAWDDIRFDRVSLGVGLTLAPDDVGILFTTPGTYHITINYRAGRTLDAWTAARLAIVSSGESCGVSVAYANMPDYDPCSTCVTFQANIVDTDEPYCLQLGRDRRGPIGISADCAPLSNFGPIGEVSTLPAVVACIWMII